MNSYYTLLPLVRELKSKLSNARFIESTTPVRQLWSALFMTDDHPVQLQFNSSADRISLFFRLLKNEEFISRKRKNRMSFFDELNGQHVQDISLAQHDRILTLSFESGNQLLFILFGAGANVVLLDKEGKELEYFRKPGTGDHIPGKSDNNTLFHPNPSLSNLTKRESIYRKPDRKIPSQPIDKEQLVRAWILDENPKLPRQLLKRLLVSGAPLWTLKPSLESEKGARDLAREMTRLITEHPEPCVLSGGICSLVPRDWISHEDYEEVSSVNEMIRRANFLTPGKHSFEAQKQEKLQKLEGLIRKRHNSLHQLADEQKTLDRANMNEKYGHILLANAHFPVQPGQKELNLENLYREAGEPERISIHIDPELSIAQNARDYYEKCEKGRRSIESLRSRKKQLEESLATLTRAKTELMTLSGKKELDTWLQTYGKQVQPLTPSLPYREIEINGWTVWIGKNSKANEMLLSLAHKEDMWLHARGVPGSHVILRMNAQRERPPIHILETAASYAAWFSKARGSSVVPVMYTRRKLVTKPRKSPPGVVHVLKEEVLLVPPVCPPQSTYIQVDDV